MQLKYNTNTITKNTRNRLKQYQKNFLFTIFTRVHIKCIIHKIVSNKKRKIKIITERERSRESF